MKMPCDVRNFLFHVLIISLFVRAKSNCPPQEDVYPCKCSDTGPPDPVTSIHCTHLSSEQDLKGVLLATRGRDIFSFEIAFSSLRFLPHDAFHGNHFNMFELRNSSLQSLTDTDLAFEGLEKALSILEIENCSFVTDWDWSQLKKLERLVEIRVTDSDLLYITENLELVSHLNVDVLVFKRNKISFVADDVFSPFSGLQHVSLDFNLITELKRSMFPNPAAKLKILSLTYNCLKTLPKDIFENMPVLESVYLSGNMISTLDEKTFKAVWPQFKFLFIYDLPLICDCRIEWIIKTKGMPKFIHSACYQPPSLKGREIDTLKATDLWC